MTDHAVRTLTARTLAAQQGHARRLRQDTVALRQHAQATRHHGQALRIQAAFGRARLAIDPPDGLWARLAALGQRPAAPAGMAPPPDPPVRTAALRDALRQQLAGRQRTDAERRSEQRVRTLRAGHPDYRRWNRHDGPGPTDSGAPP
jgi:hypothetical protein